MNHRHLPLSLLAHPGPASKCRRDRRPLTALSSLFVSMVISGCSLANAPGDPIAPPAELGSELAACESDEFEVVREGAADDELVCKKLTVCTDGQFESKAPTATSDRVCDAVTDCEPGEYQSQAPTDDSDGQCTALTECGDNEFETVAPTATSDRVCETVTDCEPGEYQSQAPTDDSDGQCTALTACTADEYESAAPTTTSDRQCAALTACTADEYESVAPTATSDRQCAALTECGENEYESAAPTATSDRQCQTMATCTIDVPLLGARAAGTCRQVALSQPIMVDGFSSSWTASSVATSDTHVYLKDQNEHVVASSNVHVTNFAEKSNTITLPSSVSTAYVSVCSYWNTAKLNKLTLEYRVAQATCN